MNHSPSRATAPGVVVGRVKPVGDQGGDDRRDHEHDQLDDAEDADAEDLAHQQVAGADGGEDDLDDPALLLLDDAGQDREAEAEDADEDEHRPDVGDQEAGLVGLGLRVEGLDRRRLLGGRQCGLVDVALVEDGLRPQARSWRPR